jgi:SHS2 domain-containing protein
MFDLMFGPGEGVGGEPFRIDVHAPTLEDLLVDWLSTLLYEAESRDLALRSFGIDDVDEHHLSGWAQGVPTDRMELIGPPVKAVTYHDLVVEKTSTGWRTLVVFDV